MTEKFIELYHQKFETDRKNTDIIRKFIKEHFLDPHQKDINIDELTEEDFDLIRKFEWNILTEQEINDRLKKLEDDHGSSSYHFTAMLKNKFLSKNAIKNKK